MCEETHGLKWLIQNNWQCNTTVVELITAMCLFQLARTPFPSPPLFLFSEWPTFPFQNTMFPISDGQLQYAMNPVRQSTKNMNNYW